MDFENKLSCESAGTLTKADIMNFITDIKEEFAVLDNKIADVCTVYNPAVSIRELQELIEELPSAIKDENKPELKVIEQNIQLLSDKLVEQINSYEAGILKNIAEIKNDTGVTETLQSSLFDAVNSAGLEAEERLNEKFKTIEKTTQGFGASLFDMNKDIREIIKTLSEDEALKQIRGDIEKIQTASTEAYDKVAAAVENAGLDAGLIDRSLVEINDKLTGLELEFKTLSDQNAQKIIDTLEGLDLDGLKTVTSELADYKSYINNIVENLRGYVEDITLAVRKQAPAEEPESSNIELFRSECSAKLAGLEEKFNSYIETLKDANEDASGKIALSTNEIKDIKSELADIFEAVEGLNVNLGAKLLEIINSLSAAGAGAAPEQIDFGGIEEKFSQFLEDFKSQRTTQNTDTQIYDTIEEKISKITQEISLVNTDLTEALDTKSRKIAEELDLLKKDVCGFFDAGFNGIIKELKSMLMSGFTEDIIDELKVQINNVPGNSPMHIAPVIDAVSELKAYIKNSAGKIEEMNSKLDVLANNEEAQIYFGEINEQLGSLLSNEVELSEVLRVVHGKIDLLMLNNESDLSAKVEELKKLLKEQRQFLSQENFAELERISIRDTDRSNISINTSVFQTARNQNTLPAAVHLSSAVTSAHSVQT